MQTDVLVFWILTGPSMHAFNVGCHCRDCFPGVVHFVFFSPFYYSSSLLLLILGGKLHDDGLLSHSLKYMIFR